MFSIGNAHAAILLLVLSQSLAFTSFQNEELETKALAEVIMGSMQVPWIKGVNLDRASENSCEEDIAALLNAINAEEMWALQMLDASSKIQSGILKGNLRDLGTYDECVKINENYNGTSIRGKHCMVSFDILSSSVCVPSSCNETDVAGIVSSVIQNVTGIQESELEISGVECALVGTKDFTTGEIVTIAFFSTICAFILFCTMCDFVKRSKPQRQYSVLNELAKFSLYTNGIAVLSTKVSPRTMPAIQGLRFLSMCWVVLGHEYTYALSKPMVNLLDILEWYNSWTAVYIQAAPFAVDTFFVVSGFLMSYLYLKSKLSGKRSNFHMMYTHRYLRLTPCVAVLMLFVTVLLHRVADGPVWESSLRVTIDNCRENWWINLLYVQNFVKVSTMCLGHSWYLAVDMQLFWLSPIILYPLHRWPKYGLGILGLFLVCSVVTPAVVLAVNGYTNAIMRFDLPIDTAAILDNFNYFYICTYTRSCAYFVGVLLGYEVATKTRCLTQTNVAINWVVASILLLICGWAAHRVSSSDFKYDVVQETVFAVLLRPFWSIAVAWIIYACTQGYGGPVTRLLSLPIFLPLSRLSYCIYLIHVIIQTVKSSAVQISNRFTDSIMLDYFWGNLVLSIVVAFFFSLFFESPAVVLEKILINPSRNRKRSPLVQEPKKDAEVGIDNNGMIET